MLAHTYVHARIVDPYIYIIVMVYSHTLKYTVHLNIPDGYTLYMYVVCNRPVW